MHVAIRPVTQAVIRARMDRIDLCSQVVGCRSDVERGRLFGLSTRTLSRAREGWVGTTFVANTLAALRSYERELAARNLRATFDELFEVVVIATNELAVAA